MRQGLSRLPDFARENNSRNVNMRLSQQLSECHKLIVLKDIRASVTVFRPPGRRARLTGVSTTHAAAIWNSAVRCSPPRPWGRSSPPSAPPRTNLRRNRMAIRWSAPGWDPTGSIACWAAAEWAQCTARSGKAINSGNRLTSRHAGRTRGGRPLK